MEGAQLAVSACAVRHLRVRAGFVGLHTVGTRKAAVADRVAAAYEAAACAAEGAARGARGAARTLGSPQRTEAPRHARSHAREDQQDEQDERLERTHRRARPRAAAGVAGDAREVAVRLGGRRSAVRHRHRRGLGISPLRATNSVRQRCPTCGERRGGRARPCLPPPPPERVRCAWSGCGARRHAVLCGRARVAGARAQLQVHGLRALGGRSRFVVQQELRFTARPWVAGALRLHALGTASARYDGDTHVSTVANWNPWRERQRRQAARAPADSSSRCGVSTSRQVQGAGHARARQHAGKGQPV